MTPHVAREVVECLESRILRSPAQQRDGHAVAEDVRAADVLPEPPD
jgi:hypothetical protein